MIAGICDELKGRGGAAFTYSLRPPNSGMPSESEGHPPSTAWVLATPRPKAERVREESLRATCRQGGQPRSIYDLNL
jgi:hypothetical protein